MDFIIVNIHIKIFKVILTCFNSNNIFIIIIIKMVLSYGLKKKK